MYFLWQFFFESNASLFFGKLYLHPLLSQLAPRTHQLVLRTLWADNVLTVCDKPLARHGLLAQGADKALGVPMPSLKRYEPCAPLPGDWLCTSSTSLCK